MNKTAKVRDDMTKNETEEKRVSLVPSVIEHEISPWFVRNSIAKGSHDPRNWIGCVSRREETKDDRYWSNLREYAEKRQRGPILMDRYGS